MKSFYNCQFVTSGDCIFFDGTASNGFQGWFAEDCNFISGGGTCIHQNCEGEDFVVSNCYINPRGAGGIGVDVEGAAGGAGTPTGVSRLWVHDCMFDTGTSVTLTGIKVRNGFELSIHDNLFVGNAGASTVKGVDVDTTNGFNIHDNTFEALSTDIIIGSGVTYGWDHDNRGTSGGATPRIVQRTDASSTSLTDLPVAFANLPSGWPTGTQAFCNNSNTTTFAATIAGGGSGNVPAYYAGSWLVG